MRYVVVGAYGFIGSFVVARLLGDGHEVVGLGRDIAAARRRFPRVAWHPGDLATITVEALVRLLRGADGVVNCAGALQDSPRDDLVAVHVEGLRRLVAASRRAGVDRFVHVSAAGVDGDATTGFARTKHAAEMLLQEDGRLAWVILRPGLVLGPVAYGGSALLRGLAALPVIPLVFSQSVVQVVSVEDVALAAARALSAQAPARVSIDLMHADRLTLETIVVAIRQWLGLSAAPVLSLPPLVASAAARVSDALAILGWRSPMRTTSLAQLRQGIAGDATAAERYLGLAPQPLQAMLEGWPSGVQERWFAKSYGIKPLVLAALVMFWLLSGLIGGLVSAPDAIAVLTHAGVPPPISAGAVFGGASIDVALAIALLVRRSARLALQGMVLVSALYMIGGTVLRPDLWLDPLGPFLKTIPAALLAVTALAILDER